MTLNRVDVPSEFAEQRGLISGASTNFKDGVFGRYREKFEHESDDVGLRDGLALADGERVVIVGLRRVTLVDKFVPWNASHRGQDALVAYAALEELRFDHLMAAVVEIGVEEHGLQFRVSGFEFPVYCVG